MTRGDTPICSVPVGELLSDMHLELIPLFTTWSSNDIE